MCTDDNIDSQEIKVSLWVIGALDALATMGLLDGNGGVELTPKGTSLYDQVDADFKPTDLEITQAVLSVKMCKSKDVCMIVRLLIKYRDSRVTLEKVARIMSEYKT